MSATVVRAEVLEELIVTLNKKLVLMATNIQQISLGTRQGIMPCDRQ